MASHLLLLGSVLLAIANAMSLSKLEAPTGLVIHSKSGRVFISGKAGKIFMAASTSATSFTLVKDLSTLVFPAGDQGLTSIAALGDTLYATYQARSNASVSECTDEGAPGTPPRADAAIKGCPSRGRLISMAISTTDGSLGDAVTMLPVGGADAPAGAVSSGWCAQFATGSVDYVSVGPDGALYVSAGVGANTNTGTVDVGQYGGTPIACGSGSTVAPFSRIQGAFRAQDPTAWNGKILRVAVSATGTLEAPTVFASGLNNPWRFVWNSSSLQSAGSFKPATTTATGDASMFSIDTGLTDHEEVNAIPGPATTSRPNFGFPCMAGVAQDAGYYPVCTGSTGWGSAAALPAFTAPLYDLSHPTDPAVISALAVHPLTGRLWIADYINGAIKSMSPNGTDLKTEFQGDQAGATGLFPVHMAWIVPPKATALDQGTMHYLDVVKGTLAPVPGQAEPKPVPSSGALATAQGAAIACALSMALACAGLLQH